MPLAEHYLRVGAENVPLSRYDGTWVDPTDKRPHLWVLLKNPTDDRRIDGREAVDLFHAELQQVVEAREAEEVAREGWVELGEWD